MWAEAVMLTEYELKSKVALFVVSLSPGKGMARN
jgi:hypothetical protein